MSARERFKKGDRVVFRASSGGLKRHNGRIGTVVGYGSGPSRDMVRVQFDGRKSPTTWFVEYWQKIGQGEPMQENERALIVHVFKDRPLRLIWVDDKGRELAVDTLKYGELAELRVAEAAVRDIQNRLATCLFKQADPTPDPKLATIAALVNEYNNDGGDPEAVVWGVIKVIDPSMQTPLDRMKGP